MTEISDRQTIEKAISDSLRCIITPDGWKLICSSIGMHELYNLREDPEETRNVIKENRDLAAGLRAQILKWQERTGDKAPLAEI